MKRAKRAHVADPGEPSPKRVTRGDVCPLTALPHDILRVIAALLSQTGSFVAFRITCKRILSATVPLCNPGLTPRRHPHLTPADVRWMFREGHKMLYMWCAANLGATSTRQDEWEAVEGDHPGMVSADLLKSVVSRRCLINVSMARGKRRMLEFVCSSRADHARQVAESAKKHINIDGLDVALKHLPAKVFVDKDWTKHFESKNCGSVVEWLSERTGLTPPLKTVLWYACRNADAAHMRWAISKGAVIQPSAYEVWGKMGRFDIIDELDKLTRGMSKGIHPNQFIYPVAMEFVRNSWWRHLGQLVRRYGLRGMPDLVKNLARRPRFLEECDKSEAFNSPLPWEPMHCK